MGKRLLKVRLARLNGVVNELLSSPNTASLFQDWDVQTRQSAVLKLESAFLDPAGILNSKAPLPSFERLKSPGGLEAYHKQLPPLEKNSRLAQAFMDLASKLSAFNDISAVDWVIDAQDFITGNVSGAVNKFADLYTSKLGDILALRPQYSGIIQKNISDRARYRDYLVAVWVNMMAHEPHGTPMTEVQAQNQLATRFHQDFGTTDDFSRPANPIVIDILIAILQAPTGTSWGFGKSAASIPAQGATAPRDYLDNLIALTGSTADSLTLRYRLDFTRLDSANSSRVDENIYTLQHFFADSFQSAPDPVHTDPDVLNDSIVISSMLGRAPFFLEYEEWLALQKPFYGENLYQIRGLFKVGLTADDRKVVLNVAEGGPFADREGWKFISTLFPVEDAMNDGFNKMDLGQYAAALTAFRTARAAADTALIQAANASPDYNNAFAARKAIKVKDPQGLLDLMDLWAGTPFATFPTNTPYIDINKPWLDDMVVRLPFALALLISVVIPTAIADAALAMGDFSTAILEQGRTTRFLVGKAKLTDKHAHRPYYVDWTRLYFLGNLPYTVDLNRSPWGYPADYPYFDDESLYGVGATAWPPADTLAFSLVPQYLHPVETQYCKLKQGQVMLEWADSLYRTNDPSNIRRARELYKGVLWLHGEIPPVATTSERKFGIGPSWIHGDSRNPWLVEQLGRANRGFYQIEAGLNYYGYTDELVPTLRYRPLKDASDRFSTLAKAAQADFLTYMQRVEDGILENIRNAAMLKKTVLESQVTQEQVAIATDNVSLAQAQVNQVLQDIKDKEQEIADHDSLFSQFHSFMKGMESVVKDLPDDTKSTIKSGLLSEAGIESMKGAGFLGLGAAGSVMAGYGVFVYAGYTTISAMADEANKRQKDLGNLMNKSLPAAQTQFDVKKRELTIASLQSQIAAADADFVKNMITFQTERFLNLEFWANVASVLKRVLRRYLELGARVGWLAERALAYEQDRTIGILRFDYFPAALQGVTGADLLQLDLAELEAARLDGIKETVPVKQTFSLARDFPLAFGQLKSTGSCAFWTQEAPFVDAHPGTYGYRIRAVTVAINNQLAARPIRGLLRNRGISAVSRLDENDSREFHVSIRASDALPISEFRLSQDLGVYSLPDEALLPFEGSGVETMWTLELPGRANPYGLDAVADILLTFDIRSNYSPALYLQDVSSADRKTQKFIWLSARRWTPNLLDDLRGSISNKVALPFDLTSLGLPGNEKNRVVMNVALFVANPKPLTLKAVFQPSNPATAVTVNFVEGVAYSNAAPLTDASSTVPASPLNALLPGLSADQIFRLTIDKTTNPGVDFSKVADVGLGIEYQADLT
jgi:hypothetical protein